MTTIDDIKVQSTSSSPWIFGVCAVLALRFGWSVALLRVVAVVMLSWFTLPIAAAYIAAAFILPETRYRTQSRTARWARRADRFVEDLFGSMRGAT